MPVANKLLDLRSNRLTADYFPVERTHSARQMGLNINIKQTPGSDSSYSQTYSVHMNKVCLTTT